MRALLASANLDRYAGQFVWLELNFDKAENSTFMANYGAQATPTFFIIDPQDGRITATQTGAMSLEELTRFLDRGAGGVFDKKQTPADAALMEADSLLAQKPAEAVNGYQKALRLAPATWSRRELATASLTVAFQYNHQFQQCAEMASSEGPRTHRDDMFARIIVSGMWCLVAAKDAPWMKAQVALLEPLAKEALSLPGIVRDHRDELYRTLMLVSLARNDEKAAAMWGDRWLGELDSIHPANEEERSAVDIARVENIQIFGDPKRILPALIASEQAMPDVWNASLRVAQMEIAAKNNDQALAACERGLQRMPGPAGRSWILQTKAEALTQTGHKTEARHTLEKALEAAQAIPNQQSRENNINRIKHALDSLTTEAAPQKK